MTHAPIVVKVIHEENIDLSEKKVKYVTKEMVENAEQIFVLCEKKDCPLFVINHRNVTFWKIADPFEASLETTREIRDSIKDLIITIL